MNKVSAALNGHIITVVTLGFMAVGAEQVVAGKLDYNDFLHSAPAAIAVGLVAVGRGLAAYKKG